MPHHMIDDDDDDDGEISMPTEDRDCLTCHGMGYIITCCDDMCHGIGQCIYGDGEMLCPECKGEPWA